MIPSSLDRTVNITYLEASLEEIWTTIATPEGMNRYLTYAADKTGAPDDIRIGDMYTLNYGDIVNHPVVLENERLKRFGVTDRYESIAPDGQTEYFNVRTTFTLEPEDAFVKLTLEVVGFGEDTHGQWFRECLEMGWRRSLTNLKSVLELGMDLRAELFSYPRMGIVNATVEEPYSVETGVAPRSGNVLLEVFPGSPAEQAGLRRGDVLTALDGRPVRDYAEFVRVISSYAGKTAVVRIAYVRDRQSAETEARLSIEETFTGLVDVETESFDDIRTKREKLAAQRSASGSLWKDRK